MTGEELVWLEAISRLHREIGKVLANSPTNMTSGTLRTLAVGQGLATEGGRAAVRHGGSSKCGLTFPEQVVHKGGLVVWYAIDRADWQASQTAASQ